LAAIDDNPLGLTMSLERLAQKPLGGRQIAALAEPEFNRVAVAVDCSVKIHPASPDFDACLVDVPYVDGPRPARALDIV
jgi:hypothetical protein